MTILVVFGLEKCITQCNCLDVLHVDIPSKLGVDVKEYGHVDCLACIQPLLLEAKALDFAEIWRYLSRRHRVGRYSDDIFGRGVCCGIESERGFAR